MRAEDRRAHVNAPDGGSHDDAGKKASARDAPGRLFLVDGSLVWSTTLHLTPTLMTLGTCSIWTVLQLRYADQLPSIFGILFRFAWVGLVMLGVWWAINHVHP